jgi:hypothetical protein
MAKLQTKNESAITVSRFLQHKGLAVGPRAVRAAARRQKLVYGREQRIALLTDQHRQKRKEFCALMLQRISADPAFPTRLLFTDEKASQSCPF